MRNNDCMLRIWLFYSSNEQIARALSLMEFARQLCEELVERYEESKVPQLYRLKKELGALKHNDLFIIIYYCK